MPVAYIDAEGLPGRQAFAGRAGLRLDAPTCDGMLLVAVPAREELAGLLTEAVAAGARGAGVRGSSLVPLAVPALGVMPDE